MPINPSIRLRDLTQSEFDERDVIVMRCAFAAQNALGRLFDERVYENDVALRLRAEGFTQVHTQVPVVVTHRTFAKEYLIDLVADDALYECKTVAMLAPPHDTQTLHYAMLLSVRHAKLLNFRATKVQGMLRFNALTDPERRRWVCDESSWREASDGCAALKQQFCELLTDWGAFLEARLYEEALIHFSGGENACGRRVPVARGGVELGTHRFNFHSDRVPFVVTAVEEDVAAHRNHLLRLIKLTAVPALQWINLDRHNIRFETLEWQQANDGIG